MPLPEWIDIFQLAQQAAVLSGQLPLARMTRLADFLAANEGEVSVRLAFVKDAGGRAFVKGDWEAPLTFQCQRCLQPMRLVLRNTFKLAPVANEDAANALSDEYEPVIQVEGTPLSSLELVEDDILLTLPLVPTHPVAECTVKIKGAAAPAKGIPSLTRPNPFAVLKKPPED